MPDTTPPTRALVHIPSDALRPVVVQFLQALGLEVSERSDPGEALCAAAEGGDVGVVVGAPGTDGPGPVASAPPDEGRLDVGGEESGAGRDLGARVDLELTYRRRAHLLQRNRIDLVHRSEGDLRDVEVHPLGRQLSGLQFLGSPLAVLPSGQEVPLYLEPDAPPGDLPVRVTGTAPDGRAFLQDRVVHIPGRR